VTVLALRMMYRREAEKQEMFDAIRAMIAETAGIPPETNEEET